MAETKLPGLIATLIICLIISTLFVLARFYSRFYLRVFHIEDWFLTIAWILNIVLTALTFVDIRYGTGRHIWTIPPSDLTPHFKIVYATGILYTLVLPITKLSICFLYERVVDIKRVQKNLIRVLEVLLTLTAIGFTCYQINQCTPVSAFWNDPFGPQCLRKQTKTPDVLYAIAAWNTFSDLYIIVIVFEVVWSLTLDLKTRIALYGVVCIGVSSMISSILRITILAGKLNPTDPSWAAADMDIWSCIECNTSLICAAAPCIRPFIMKVRTIFSLASRSSIPTTEHNEYEGSTTLVLAPDDEWKRFGFSRTPTKSQTQIVTVTPPQHASRTDRRFNVAEV